MPIQFSCACGRRYSVKDELAGKRVQCKQCGQVLRIPAARSMPPAPPAPAPVAVPEQYAAPQYAPPQQPYGQGHATQAPYPQQPFAPQHQSEYGLAADPSQQPQPGFVGAGGMLGGEAGNPGSLKFEPGTYLKCFPLWPALWTTLLLVSIAATLVISYWLGIFAALVAFLYVMYWNRISATFKFGNVCPAIVISQQPWLVAVFGEMGREENVNAPCIKIIPQPLGRMTARGHSPGHRRHLRGRLRKLDLGGFLPEGHQLRHLEHRRHPAGHRHHRHG